jgi:hypothetical protein
MRKCLARQKWALSAAVVLSTAFSASAATKHHRVTHILWVNGVTLALKAGSE